MAFNGSGVFNRVHDWTDDKDGAILVTASRMDAEDDGFATGLSNCVTKDGQTTVTANLPMATNRHTGVGNAAARTDYAAAGQISDGALVYAADSGAADAYVITLAPAITAYAAGQAFYFKATNANTGASTLNVNGVGVKAITDSAIAALVGGEIAAGGIYQVVYDGTQFQLMRSTTIAHLDAAAQISNSSVLSGGVGVTSVTESPAGTFTINFDRAAPNANTQFLHATSSFVASYCTKITGTDDDTVVAVFNADPGTFYITRVLPG